MSYLVPAEEVVKAYVELRERMIALLRGLPEDAAQIIVPHCPEWTVQETVSHMMGVPEAIMLGDMEGVAGEEWTQRQVERHRGDSLKDLADAWEAQGPQFLQILPNIPQPTLSQFVFDVTSHEHDVRHAVGQPGARDSVAVTVGLGFIKTVIDSRDGIDIAEVNESSVSTFDLFRSLGGRRSREQIAAIGLDVEYVEKAIDPLPYSIPIIPIPE
ncbi:unannotated protein [freshwater metagenome]|uniref:Unannotated protein n=1 Tax=freshwater metagenome TaxID=449393 RepID=A0A6J6LL30_9ZZZZ|nr:maleylpyruvate isomerase family mycothiol-dependent enzyme [Actinomycetota bacterium]